MSQPPTPPAPQPPPSIPDPLAEQQSNASISSIVSDLLAQVQEHALALSGAVREYIPAGAADSVVSKFIVTVLSSVVVFVVVVLFVGIGWFVVWRFFLSRFKFVRELVLGNAMTPTTETAPSSRGANAQQQRKKRRRPHYD